MSRLEVRNIVKRFGSHAVVDGVSFTVQAGEFFVIIGPSGCGKSTLMRIICGLEQPDAGQVIIDGKDVTTVPPRQRNIGMVFQDYGLYPNMDVYNNIAYGMQARGMKADEIARRISLVAEQLGLTDLLRHGVVDLSGGEQQRVALARALSKDAALYLYDEPLSNLDPKLRGSARRDILWGHREKQKPSVYVTHDQIEAFSMADRIAVMGAGRLQQVGTPDDILNHPANLYVARFMGSPPINLFEGDIVARDGALRFTAPGGVDLALPDHLVALVPGGRERVVLGVRPDALALAVNGEHAGPAFSMQIDTVEPMLGETIVSGRAGDALITAVLDDLDAVDLQPDSTVTLAIAPERMLLFDSDTQTALTA